MSRPTLWLRPLNGLGNRMRAIAAARALAATTDAALTVFWEVGPGLEARYEDLFEPDGACKVRNIDPRVSRADALAYLLYSEHPAVRGVPTGWIPRALFGERILRQLRPEDHAPEALERLVRRGPRTLITSWWAFYGGVALDFSFFRPRPAQRAAVDAIAARFGPAAIGVHIRRTDNVNAIRLSPTAAFVAAMADAVDADADARFFLATDCPDTERQIVARFGRRVITRPRETSRDSRQGMLDAVIDLFALARTRRILGSYYSTFSETAASLGGVPWVTVTDDSRVVGHATSDVLLVGASR